MQVINTYLTADTFLAGYYVNHPAWSSVDAVSGVTYTRIQASDRLGGGLGSHPNASDADDGDSMSWSFLSETGTYTFSVLYSKYTSRGIIEFLVDDVSIGTVDMYNGSSVLNVVTDMTDIALVEGTHTLKALVNGKNASSSDYIMAVEWFSFTRTGA